MAYCERCERSFRTWYSYNQHISDSPNHYICHDCDKDFATWEFLRQHWIQCPQHHFCRQCNTHLGSSHELLNHCLNAHDYCNTCDKFFKNGVGLYEHNAQCHWTRRFSCAECQRFFSSESNLRAHNKSNVHRAKNVPCAFQHHGCTQWFVTMSAMIHHLESGACLSHVDRDVIKRWILQNDNRNVITVPQRLLTDGGTTRYFATERSWNGGAYECVLCHTSFHTLDALNRHLASPRHEERVYRCPLSTCQVKFRTLGALCQHVESEKCGVSRFQAARDGMQKLLNGMQRARRIQG